MAILLQELQRSIKFSIDEIIEEAYDRLGIFTLNGGHMKTARRSLNIMFQEWVIEVFIIGK
jgi:hypothetical protein